MLAAKRILVEAKTKSQLKCSILEELSRRDEEKDGSFLIQLLSAWFSIDDAPKLRYTLDDMDFIDVVLDIFENAPAEEWKEAWCVPIGVWNFDDFGDLYLLHSIRNEWITLEFLMILDAAKCEYWHFHEAFFEDVSIPSQLRRKMGPFLTPDYRLLKTAIALVPGLLESEEMLVEYFVKNKDTGTDGVYRELLKSCDSHVTLKVVNAAINTLHGQCFKHQTSRIPDRFNGMVHLDASACRAFWMSLRDYPKSHKVIDGLARLLDDTSLRSWVDYVTNDPEDRYAEGISTPEKRAATIEAVRATLRT